MTMIDRPPTTTDATDVVDAEPTVQGPLQLRPELHGLAMTETPPVCDYLHDEIRSAAWALIGESGDYYVCDEHFQMRTEEDRRNWRPVELLETVVLSPESAAEPMDAAADVQEPEEVVVIPDRTGGWAETADVEQRQRLHAARNAAAILREQDGSGMSSVDSAQVIQLAKWIVYGS
jgi:hypothetical protein